MKWIQLIGCFLVSIAIVACGGGASSESDSSGSSSTAATQETTPPTTETASTPPKVAVPKGPPPTKKVVIETLKKGDGAQIKAGQEFTANVVGVNYKTGEQFEASWGKSPFEWRFGTGEMVKGLEIGFKGMKVGERRKLIVPSSLAYGTGALVYLVELRALG